MLKSILFILLLIISLFSFYIFIMMLIGVCEWVGNSIVFLVKSRERRQYRELIAVPNSRSGENVAFAYVVDGIEYHVLIKLKASGVRKKEVIEIFGSTDYWLARLHTEVLIANAEKIDASREFEELLSAIVEKYQAGLTGIKAKSSLTAEVYVWAPSILYRSKFSRLIAATIGPAVW